MGETAEERFNILICIDGSEESYRALRYAIKFSVDHDDTDITLLYVRPADAYSGGFNMELAREAMLDWDMDLPGLKSLKKARSILVDSGFLGDEWGEDSIKKRSRGSRLGNHLISYTSKTTGQHITLMVRVSTSVLAGIMEETYSQDYDLVIVDASDDENMRHAGHIDIHTAVSVATEHDGTVILARSLEDGHGHLVCLTDPETDIEAARKDAVLASRCGCPIYLYAVVENDDGLKEAEELLDLAETAIEALGIKISGRKVDIGDPVTRIIEEGREHSLIVTSACRVSRLRRMFMGSVSHDVLKKAKNSVMIVR